MATPVTAALPAWAVELRDLFRSGSTAQFLLHGNVFDLVPAAGQLLSLPAFLDDVLFAGYDVVLHYDRSRGVRATRGAEDWAAWLEQALGAPDAGRQTMSLVREPGSALELIDRYLLRTLNLDALKREPGARRKVAVVVEFAEFVVPRGDAVQLGGAFSANVVKTLGWANDPAILHANIVTVFISERLHDLNELIVGNPHAANIHLPLPSEADMLEYVRALEGSQFPAPSHAERRVHRGSRGAARGLEPGRRAHGDRPGTWQRTQDHGVVARPDQEGDHRARMPGSARFRRVAVHPR